MITRDDLIREYRSRSATFPAFAVVYLMIVGTLGLTAYAIV
ncbi:hypothetical protein [Vannielia litorea]|nr:hypothetical protein [Vannielia litorea]